MKRYSIFVIILVLAVLASSCRMENPFLGIPERASVALPPDQINDGPRSYGGVFEFKTLLPVELDLNVNLYESLPAATGPSSLQSLPAQEVLVIVKLVNSKGSPVYSGRLAEDGTLRAPLQLPAAAEDLTLTLKAEGFEERSVLIRNMVQYEKVSRTMSLLTHGFRAKELPLDSDGDTIPDADDDFPDDPLRAFRDRIPAEQSLSLAFEDLFLHALAGDADYNDFLGRYYIEVIKNAQNLIVELRGTAEAVVKIAGYNHLFGLMIDFFKGDGLLSVEYRDKSGNVLPESFQDHPVSEQAIITLFESTKISVGRTTTFSLWLKTPQLPEQLDAPAYNPYIYVYDTSYDIHMLGEKPLPNSKNPPDSPFRDEDGFPWVLLVPMNWIHPEECQRIEIPYPRFTLWRESLGTEHQDWYLHY